MSTKKSISKNALWRENQQLQLENQELKARLAAKSNALMIPGSTYNTIYNEGRLDAAKDFDKYLMPALRAMEDLNLTGTTIAVTVLWGHGNVTIQAMRSFLEDLGSAMSNLRGACAYARGQGNLAVETPDLSRAQHMFAGIERFLEDPTDNGEHLRQIVKDSSTRLAEMFDVRDNFKPGPKTGKKDDTKLIARKAHEFIQEGHIAKSAFHKTVDYFRTIDPDDISKHTGTARDAARRIQNISNPYASVRDHYYDVYRDENL